MRRAVERLAFMNIIGLGMGGVYMGMELQPEYYLTVISDEQTPLAASAPGTETFYFPWVVVVMLLMALIAAAMLYFNRCMKYRAYYYEMIKEDEASQKVPKAGWNLIRLKKLVNETENRLVEQMLSEA